MTVQNGMVVFEVIYYCVRVCSTGHKKRTVTERKRLAADSAVAATTAVPIAAAE